MMKIKSSVNLMTACIALGMAFCRAASGQGNDLVPSLSLKVQKRVTVKNASSAPIMVPAKCDASGNIYLRQYQFLNPFAAPVVRISRDGESTTIFALRKVPGFEKGQTLGFAVNPRGGGFQLAIKSGREIDIVGFDGDGEYESTASLSPPFEPAQVAAFDTGDFLVTGTKLSDKDGSDTGKPFTAIYDRLGNLIKPLTLPGDAKGSEAKGSDGHTEAENDAVTLGTAESGDDGNIYIMRGTCNPVVYVVSAAGEVVRKFTLKPPATEFSPITMKVSAGKMVVMFEKQDPKSERAEQIFSVFDTESGEKSMDLMSGPDIGGAFACYTPNGLTFLGTDNEGRLVMMSAVPR